MHPLEKQTLRIIQQEKLAGPGDNIVVAVSAGPDSTALLQVLAALADKLQISLIAAYVDHGLRPAEAKQEAALVKKQAKELGIGYVTGRVDVRALACKRKISLEHASRDLRYGFLEKTAREKKARKIALAHTADDQVEEVLLRLLRGTGRKGLSGMSLKSGDLIRPFLKIPKSDLLAYLAEQQIPYLEDSSNKSRVFTRNRVRLDLIPYLADSFNPNIRRTILQTAEILQDEELLLEEITRKACHTVFIDQEHSEPPALNIDLPLFSLLLPAIQRRVLEAAFWQLGSEPRSRQIRQLMHIIGSEKKEARLHFKSGLRVKKKEDRLHFSFPGGRGARRGNLDD